MTTLVFSEGRDFGPFPLFLIVGCPPSRVTKTIRCVSYPPLSPDPLNTWGFRDFVSIMIARSFQGKRKIRASPNPVVSSIHFPDWEFVIREFRLFYLR